MIDSVDRSGSAIQFYMSFFVPILNWTTEFVPIDVIVLIIIVIKCILAIQNVKIYFQADLECGWNFNV